MLAIQHDVFSIWEQRVRNEIIAARTLDRPILINTFPAFYGELADAICEGHDEERSRETSTTAVEHGGERARLTEYSPQDLILEWQILRETVIDQLDRDNVTLSKGKRHLMNALFDSALRESVTAYTLAQAALRERFIAALTHDLRIPLSAANTGLQLAKQLSNSARQNEVLSLIERNHLRMDAMIRDLLDAMVFQAGARPKLRLENIDILDVANEVREHFNGIHGERVEIDATSVKGWWDRTALRRALDNLVENGLKYGAPAASVLIQTISYDGRLVLNVHNSGEPVAPEDVETIFQVFKRATAARRGEAAGWGIGLPYVRSVAESHGGSIAVRSSMDHGTTFTIDIPLDCRQYQNAPVL
jgi:signal transduction histidine kinase